MLEIPQSPISLHISELLPAGEHFFTLTPPRYLHEKLTEPYMAIAVHQVNRPTGGSSWNPITRYLYNWRLRRRLPQLLEAISRLEYNIQMLKFYHSETAPRLIAQAEDLLWYMKKEPGEPELNTLFDAFRAVTPDMGWGVLELQSVAMALLTYIDSLAQRRSRVTSKSVMFTLDAHRNNASFLMDKIAERLDVPVGSLLAELRDIMSKR